MTTAMEAMAAMDAEQAEVPLMWTVKGNRPIAEMDRRVDWDDQPQYVAFRETWTDKLTGEVMSQSVAVYSKVGLEAMMEQGSIG